MISFNWLRKSVAVALSADRDSPETVTRLMLWCFFHRDNHPSVAMKLSSPLMSFDSFTAWALRMGPDSGIPLSHCWTNHMKSDLPVQHAVVDRLFWVQSFCLFVFGYKFPQVGFVFYPAV